VILCILNAGDFISWNEKQVLEYGFVFTPFAFHWANEFCKRSSKYSSPNFYLILILEKNHKNRSEVRLFYRHFRSSSRVSD